MTLTFTSLLWVAAGGALGGMGRLALSTAVARWLGTHFPWGTLVVNLSGAFAAGWLAGYLSGSPLPEGVWLFLMIGVLGGYTTVSSLSLQTLTLWRSGQPHQAAMNLIGTTVAGVALAAMGWLLAASLAGAAG